MRWTSVEDLPIDLQGTARQVVADMTRQYPRLDLSKVEGVVVAAVEVAANQSDDDRPFVRRVEDLSATVFMALADTDAADAGHDQEEHDG
jgi:hypothetical protein